MSKSMEKELESAGIEAEYKLESPISLSEDEKALVRKLDRRILPLACLLYLFACKQNL